ERERGGGRKRWPRGSYGRTNGRVIRARDLGQQQARGGVDVADRAAGGGGGGGHSTPCGSGPTNRKGLYLTAQVACEAMPPRLLAESDESLAVRPLSSRSWVVHDGGVPRGRFDGLVAAVDVGLPRGQSFFGA